MGVDLSVYRIEYLGIGKAGFDCYSKVYLGDLHNSNIINYFHNHFENGLDNNAYYEITGHDFHECLRFLKQNDKNEGEQELKSFVERMPEVNDDEEEYYEIMLSY